MLPAGESGSGARQGAGLWEATSYTTACREPPSLLLLHTRRAAQKCLCWLQPPPPPPPVPSSQPGAGTAASRLPTSHPWQRATCGASAAARCQVCACGIPCHSVSPLGSCPSLEAAAGTAKGAQSFHSSSDRVVLPGGKAVAITNTYKPQRISRSRTSAEATLGCGSRAGVCCSIIPALSAQPSPVPGGEQSPLNAGTG